MNRTQQHAFSFWIAPLGFFLHLRAQTEKTICIQGFYQQPQKLPFQSKFQFLLSLKILEPAESGPFIASVKLGL